MVSYSSVIDKELYNQVNIWEDKDYEYFLHFNSLYYIQGVSNQTLKFVISNCNLGHVYDYVDYTQVLSVCNVPMYVFDNHLNVGPNIQGSQLEPKALYMPKVGLLVVGDYLNPDIINHELIHAIQEMMIYTNRFELFQLIKIKNIWLSKIINFFNPLQFTPKNQNRIFLNKIFLKIRKEAHAYIFANPGVLAGYSAENSILCLTSETKESLQSKLGEEFYHKLLKIILGIHLYEKNVWPDSSKKLFLKQLMTTPDFDDFMIWLGGYIG